MRGRTVNMWSALWSALTVLSLVLPAVLSGGAVAGMSCCGEPEGGCPTLSRSMPCCHAPGVPTSTPARGTDAGTRTMAPECPFPAAALGEVSLAGFTLARQRPGALEAGGILQQSRVTLHATYLI